MDRELLLEKQFSTYNCKLLRDIIYSLREENYYEVLESHFFLDEFGHRFFFSFDLKSLSKFGWKEDPC